MTPGYYVVVRDHVLAAGAPKASYRLKLHKGDWLITDGSILGRFDKTEELDWVPLEWVRGVPVVLNETIDAELARCAVPTIPQKLETTFHKLMFVEPGEPLPDLPRPPLGQLASYLHSRRGLVAASYTYDRRL